ncbi:alpha/beta hydrolase family protein [Polaribacter ponticola]|uniref:Alpha/beta hydrolase n=1 Tax=Polaribacter ponticola TaxID=2978475 RepID=A0ABT5SBK2_9FLAO|nr:alpha/beta hydrolase [Polaribacter sp. MSW5]MDD7915508.1 alpha/beta hydrolase [Polaribacter sp. MSW5]
MKINKNIVVKGKHQKPIVTDVFYNETHQPKKVVIFCHGYKGFKDWGAWNLMAEAFANAGFFFIKFNFSHNGGTLEEPIDFPDLEAFGNNNYSKELDDLGSVIDWISSEEDFINEVDITNISIIGHSRGGGIVLLKSAEDSRVKNVITLAGVCDFEKRTATVGDLEQWKKDGVKYVLNGRTKQNMPHFYQFYEDFINNKERFDVKKATENIKVPHLIIHGNKDTSVFINEAENLYTWNPKSNFKIIENANHVFNVSHPWKNDKMSKELEKVKQLCVDFLI